MTHRRIVWLYLKGLKTRSNLNIRRMENLKKTLYWCCELFAEVFDCRGTLTVSCCRIISI